MDRAARKFQKEMNSGAISLVVLAILEQASEPLYGYAIAKRLEGMSGDTLPMNQAAIYPVLRSLEKQRLLRSKLQPSDVGPPRRYYSLTSAGERALEEWRQIWRQTKEFVDDVLEQGDEQVDGQDAASGSHGVPGAARASGQAKDRRRSGRDPV
ncbi:MAG: PadR family transcriptional regulator [Planctomycetales bacterium]|nr:PadR family transcriptional regulator [Planctomycetales bacterium]